VVAFAASSALSTTSASAAVTSTMVCIGTMTVTYSTPITPTPSISANGITLNGSGTCTGLSNGAGSWTGTATAAAGTSCTGAVVATNGSGLITPPLPATPIGVTFAGGGTTAVQTWVFSSGLDGKLVAVGGFVVFPPTQISDCITSGSASSITMTGALVVVF
jgi:hypothetical protein